MSTVLEMGRGEVVETQTAPDINARSVLRKTLNPVTLKLADVVYKINTKKKENVFNTKHSKTEGERVILNGVTGVVYPGELLAMLGPSGSGKTTLLSALGGRLGGNLSGKITYNGKPFTSSMKRNTGFVTQDDVLYPHLTVTETLVYTALLRLPNDITKEQKLQHAENIIMELGLTGCKNNIIGGQLIRGVSGGERKRVSIGQEMLINPSLLFLDEPTSGLDSTTAQRIVSTLWELARCGRTIVMTIHQPSSRLFNLFHKVIVLSDGNPIYFGKGSDAMEYFASIGHALPMAMNPSDFLLDLANGISTDEREVDQKVVKQVLVAAYHNNIESGLREEVGILEGYDHAKLNEKRDTRWATTWWQQFTVLLERGLKERKHSSFSWLKIMQVMFVALVSGLIWWHSGVDHLQDQIGLLFFYSGFWSLFPLFQALHAFPPERAILAKERSSGMYRLSSYFIARIAGDIPMELALPTAFLIVTYFMAGLKTTAGSFFETFFYILLGVLVAQGIGMALGAFVMDIKSATTLGSVVMLTFLLASGYYVQHVPVFISWIQYISLPHYSFKLLIEAQYHANQYYPCAAPNGYCRIKDFPLVAVVGLDQKGLSIMAMVIMLVGYRLIAYACLTRIGVIH